MADKLLDARDLQCPFPILKTKRAISTIAVGQTLEVLATDPGAEDDFEAFALSTGHQLVDCARTDEGVFRFVLRRTR